MKKGIAIIFAGLAMYGAGISSSYASGESVIHDTHAEVINQDSIRNSSMYQIESLDKEADLELTDRQKEQLVKVLISYNEARHNADLTYESSIEDIEKSFNDTMKNVLTSDQMADLENYNNRQLEQYEKEDQEALERYEREYQEAINAKSKKGTEGGGPTSPRNNKNPETP